MICKGLEEIKNQRLWISNGAHVQSKLTLIGWCANHKFLLGQLRVPQTPTKPVARSGLSSQSTWTTDQSFSSTTSSTTRSWLERTTWLTTWRHSFNMTTKTSLTIHQSASSSQFLRANIAQLMFSCRSSCLVLKHSTSIKQGSRNWWRMKCKISILMPQLSATYNWRSLIKQPKMVQITVPSCSERAQRGWFCPLAISLAETIG